MSYPFSPQGFVNVATDSGGTIAGQCAIAGTTLTVTAASNNTSAWSVLW